MEKKIKTRPMALSPPSLFLNLFLILIFSSPPPPTSVAACRDTCGSVPVKYPFGTGPGCGSPLFNPYITCTSFNVNATTAIEQLMLKTHTGSYPINSISYTTSTLTLTPSHMSTCTTMQSSPNNFGLDLTTPFQLDSSTFILLSCPPPTSSLTIESTPVCDPSFDYLCAAIYTCPSVVSLGLPLFPPTNTCCVYAPANLDGEGELDLRELKCGAYASVVSLGDNPTDPTHWVYGVQLKYSYGAALDSNVQTTKCSSCEMSGGTCGYAPPGNGFACVCKGGYNTSLDCSNYAQNQEYLWDSLSSPLSAPRYIWSSFLAGIVSSLVSTRVIGAGF